jgi:hypothetical protein
MDEMPMTIDAPNMYHFDLNSLSYLQEFVLLSLRVLLCHVRYIYIKFKTWRSSSVVPFTM